MSSEIILRHGYRVLVLRGNWRPQSRQAFLREAANGIELWPADGEPQDIEFVRELPHLKYFSSNLTQRVDFSGLDVVPGLEWFKAITPSISAVDFSRHVHLSHVSIPWNPTYESVFESPGLRSLAVFDLDARQIERLGKLVSLEALELRNSGITSLAPLRGLLRLRKLRVGLCRKLQDIGVLSDFRRLQLLSIATCRKIESYEVLGSLDRLKYLFLLNGGRVPNLGFLRRLQDLRLLSFDFQVADNDLSVVADLPELKVFIFKAGRGYTPALGLRGISSDGEYELGPIEKLFLAELHSLP